MHQFDPRSDHAVSQRRQASGYSERSGVARDPPRDDSDFVKPDNGFDYSYQLIDFIKTQGDFSIGTAGFPESHTACTDGKHVDWQRVKDKIDHGADFVLTQLFFDNAHYFELRDYLVGTLGVTAPITPGILPILSTEQIKRFTTLCGPRYRSVSSLVWTRSVTTLRLSAHSVSSSRRRQCEELLRGGAPGLHLYSLNRSPACLQILDNLGLSTTSGIGG